MIRCGDCLEIMREMTDNSIDTIITDPPYALEFMGKGWDKVLPPVETWVEALRVAKPGAMLMAFGGTRTYHRLTCAIEDAEWEIRDCVMWVYGSGFPKSHDISKGIDKRRGTNETEFANYIGRKRQESNISRKELNEMFGYVAGCNWWEAKGTNFRYPNWKDYRKLKKILKLDDRYDGNLREEKRELVGKRISQGGMTSGGNEFGRALSSMGREIDITVPATSEAETWDGYGTALKPAWEPIVLAMKPLDGTFAQNALKWGVAGLWIDGGRVEWQSEEDKTHGHPASFSKAHPGFEGKSFAIADRSHRDPVAEQPPQGRWPANLIHDGSEEVVGEFPQTSVTGKRKDPTKGYHQPDGGEWFGRKNHDGAEYQDSGTAARFFYCAKASRTERNKGCGGMEEKQRHVMGNMSGGTPGQPNAYDGTKSHNSHPTVKPISLMRYLCRLTRMPEGGTVLDPFMGSGSTGIAAKLEGREFIGIDKESEYCEIAKNRIEAWEPEEVEVDDQKEFGF